MTPSTPDPAPLPVTGSRDTAIAAAGLAADGRARDADGRFAVLRSDERFRGKIFSVRVDDVLMPGGAVARRDVVEHLPAVAVVPLDEDGNVVLIEQFRHPLRRRLWEIPAGLMDVTDEEPLACAQRELVEEVGLAADRWSVLVDLASSPGYSTEGVRVYLATGLRPVAAPPASDEEADLRVVRVPLDVAVEAIARGDIVSASAVAGLLATAHRVVTTSLADHPAAGRGDTPWIKSQAAVNQPARNAPGRIGTAPVLGPVPSRPLRSPHQDD